MVQVKKAISHFFSQVTRLRHVKRWSTMDCVIGENVLEHSFDTAVISHLMAALGNARLGKNWDINEVAVSALYHDLDEGLAGDTISTTKYSNPEMLTAFKKFEAECEKNILQMLPEDLKPELERHVIASATPPHVKKLVKGADIISAYVYSLRELKRGNSEFRTVAQDTKEILDNYELEEVGLFMEVFLPSLELTVHEIAKDSFTI